VLAEPTGGTAGRQIRLHSFHLAAAAAAEVVAAAAAVVAAVDSLVELLQEVRLEQLRVWMRATEAQIVSLAPSNAPFNEQEPHLHP